MMMDGSTFCGGILMMIAWLILILLAMVALVKWILGSQKQGPTNDFALAVVLLFACCIPMMKRVMGGGKQQKDKT